MVDKGLLMHWWHYYGKLMYSLAELQIFEAIIDKYGVDKILEIAMFSYICSDGSPTIMLESIRRNYVDDLINSLPDIEALTDAEKESYNKAKENFVKQISETYGLEDVH